MIRFIIVGITSGLLFGTMDALINANPYAQKLNKAYKPIARSSINAGAGIVIDLVYGFAMAGVFLILFSSLPGESAVLKGLSFGILTWFFRVFMYGASHWMMFEIPSRTIAYNLVTGLFEMLIIGLFYGLTLK